MPDNKKSAVALGLFDGVHLGHRAVISLPVKMAEKGFVPSVFTFRSGSLRQKQCRRIDYIYSDSQKNKLLSELGIVQIFSEDFNNIKSLSGEEFVKNILINKLNAGFVSCGRDFRFGKNASCNAADLAGFGEKFGFQVEIADDISFNGENVSSNRIRELLKKGCVPEANTLLGEEYRIDGKVVHGRQLGRTLDFPTVNQLYDDAQLIPRKGVYRSAAFIGGKKFDSITNIGVKPTVDKDISPLAETHILGFDSDVYGENITVKLLGFVRDERKFDSIEELRNQIACDIKSCERNA